MPRSVATMTPEMQRLSMMSDATLMVDPEGYLVWHREHAAALTALQARANAAEAKLDQIDSLCKDAIRMCNDGHPVSAKNLALAICKIKGPTT